MRFDVIQPLPKERIHTYYFLQFARRLSPVYLSMEVDMAAIVRARQRIFEEKGLRVSYLSFLVEQAAAALRKYPEANAAVKHGWFPKRIIYRDVHAKFMVDKEIRCTRAVVPGLIEHADRLSLVEIQQRVDYYRRMRFEDLRELHGIRKLQECPRLVGQRLFNLLLSGLRTRAELQGTFAVSSLGHRPVHAFFPLISATVCFGMGAIQDRPAAVDGVLQARPTMTLSMAFDHAAIDGALAADVLNEVKTNLERYDDGAPRAGSGARTLAARGARI